MNIEDVVYSADQRNRPGRNSLVAVSDSLFNSGPQGLVGNTVTIQLPAPPTGFLRVWQHIVFLPSACAAGDVFLLTRLTPDLLIQSVLNTITGYGSPFNFPAIGAIFNFPNTQILPPLGGRPIVVGQESILRIIGVFAAPVAQTINVSGWYKDVPF